MSIEDRMTRLETMMEERWASHNKASDEHWQGIKSIIIDLRNDVKFASNRIMELPCKAREAQTKEKEKTLDEKFRNRDLVSGVNWTVLLAMIVAFINEWIHRK